MSRRKSYKEDDENIIEDEVIMRWSAKRIFIATVIVVAIIAGGIYTISLLSQNKAVLGERSDKPYLKLPNERTVEKVLEKAQEDLANINTKNIVSSQPKIQKIIEDLQNLTTSTASAKNLICDAICK